MNRVTLIIVALLIGIGLSSIFKVDEGERAIVTRFKAILKTDVDGNKSTKFLLQAYTSRSL